MLTKGQCKAIRAALRAKHGRAPSKIKGCPTKRRK